ncbi:MAG TPA: hypothetical protein VGP72_17450 [Planctomycetota bacterium]|jgi:hypothetical protein
MTELEELHRECWWRTYEKAYARSPESGNATERNRWAIIAAAYELGVPETELTAIVAPLQPKTRTPRKMAWGLAR